ncbi:hypothetical protein RHAL1_01333 [Beijerinckiaceae bacterium RH AL1]|jgi:hypothetical protein|nr:hypothetical protein [Beijerinckiaceae bacterium]VVB44591.1 hypothetical protein RHCH11_RHCH11_01302 [Beijerinckiaceae bacterium RH CH11]VVB44669.1 hypothetical protein RHAL8_01299 [Beijerinckiaceae bacterium RH AL8]VVC54435.1 hypothetical protein RHAL1_01333 [Beijerinckiaceae bacterium RH AL1]
MRHIVIATALVIGLAGPAFAQNRTLPAGSEGAAQPPIDWSVGMQRRAARHILEGRSVSVGPVVIVPAPSGDED